MVDPGDPPDREQRIAHVRHRVHPPHLRPRERGDQQRAAGNDCRPFCESRARTGAIREQARFAEREGPLRELEEAARRGLRRERVPRG